MQGSWRLMGSYWVMLEPATMELGGHGLPVAPPGPSLMPPLPTPSTSPQEKGVMLGVLSLPTLCGGMRRWNR
jgi:hypothetical protein